MFKLTNVNPDFWIQLIGDNAGKPLKEELANSIGIKCDPAQLEPDFLFYVVLYLHRSGDFKPYVKGSVVPFIRHDDIHRVILNHFFKTSFIFSNKRRASCQYKSQGHG